MRFSFSLSAIDVMHFVVNTLCPQQFLASENRLSWITQQKHGTHTHKQIVRIWNNSHRIRLYAKIEKRIWKKRQTTSGGRKSERERERRKVVSVPYTRQHSPRRLKKRDSCYATLTATLIVCCCCCGCLGRVWACNANVRCVFPFSVAVEYCLLLCLSPQNWSRRAGCQLQNRLQLTR